MLKEDLERLDDAGMDAWDRHDADGFVDLLADGFAWVDDGIPEPMRTREAAKQYVETWFTAFPDMRVRTTKRVVGDDDSVAAEVEYTGTNTGRLNFGGMDLPATGKKITGRGCYFVTAENGKIKEFHTHPDAAGMMAQLGLMPAQA
jgi:steroid delta-isomerase-like uncharacterized protein